MIEEVGANLCVDIGKAEEVASLRSLVKKILTNPNTLVDEKADLLLRAIKEYGYVKLSAASLTELEAKSPIGGELGEQLKAPSRISSKKSQTEKA